MSMSPSTDEDPKIVVSPTEARGGARGNGVIIVLAAGIIVAVVVMFIALRVLHL